ncbi:MAG: hypothetical protein QXJ14_04190 [Candidatus Aenigmatarchaeota archaeon]
MKSKIIEEMMKNKVKITEDCDFFTKRDNIVIVKFKKDKYAKVEYLCNCGYQEIKEIEIKIGKPKTFKCSNCNKEFIIESLKKK